MLMVKISKGIKPRIKIRLRGMGTTEDKKLCNLYLHIKVKD